MLLQRLWFFDIFGGRSDTTLIPGGLVLLLLVDWDLKICLLLWVYRRRTAWLDSIIVNDLDVWLLILLWVFVHQNASSGGCCWTWLFWHQVLSFNLMRSWRESTKLFQLWNFTVLLCHYDLWYQRRFGISFFGLLLLKTSFGLLWLLLTSWWLLIWSWSLWVHYWGLVNSRWSILGCLCLTSRSALTDGWIIRGNLSWDFILWCQPIHTIELTNRHIDLAIDWKGVLETNWTFRGASVLLLVLSQKLGQPRGIHIAWLSQGVFQPCFRIVCLLSSNGGFLICLVLHW